MFPLKSRFGVLPGERERFVRQDLKGVKFFEGIRRAGKDPMPIDGTGVQADFRFGANRPMEGKGVEERQPGKRGHLLTGEDGLPAVKSKR